MKSCDAMARIKCGAKLPGLHSPSLENRQSIRVYFSAEKSIGLQAFCGGLVWVDPSAFEYRPVDDRRAVERITLLLVSHACSIDSEAERGTVE